MPGCCRSQCSGWRSRPSWRPWCSGAPPSGRLSGACRRRRREALRRDPAWTRSDHSRSTGAASSPWRARPRRDPEARLAQGTTAAEPNARDAALRCESAPITTRRVPSKHRPRPCSRFGTRVRQRRRAAPPRLRRLPQLRRRPRLPRLPRLRRLRHHRSPQPPSRAEGAVRHRAPSNPSGARTAVSPSGTASAPVDHRAKGDPR